MQEHQRGFTEYEFKPALGLNESLRLTAPEMTHFIQCQNWRISQDQERIEKRNGLTQITAITGGATIYGYATYYNSTPAFCQLAVTATDIWRKTGAGAWTNVYSFPAPTPLTHAVKIIEVQGKQFIINEIVNVMILPNGTVTTVGITAPATIPTVTASYDATLLADAMTALTAWADADAGGGASTAVTYDGKTTMSLANTHAATTYAKRTITVAGVGPEYGLDFSVYFDLLGTVADVDYFQMDVFNGRICFQLRIDKNDAYIYTGGYWVSLGQEIHQDKWLNFKISVDSTANDSTEYATVYLDDTPVGDYFCQNRTDTTPGLVTLTLYGTTIDTIAYIDYFNMCSTTGGRLVGKYRYAVTYLRGGNYPCESNPIKSIIGSVAFSVAPGLNDMTVTGTYTADTQKTFVVKVTTAATPDKIDWSEDGGVTWASKAVPLTSKIYLPYGIEINFAATTGHTATNTWTFTCYPISVIAVHQRVTLTSIPTSAAAQVTARNIYRTSSGGTAYYLLATINDNTTTSFEDNVRDSALSLDMDEGRDVAPLGKYFTWWDDRMWILDETQNIVYYSQFNKPEEFNTSALGRLISVRSGENNDIGTGIQAFKDYLYIFKKGSIYLVRKRLDGTYGRYEVSKDIGLIAPHSLCEAYGLLMFLSARGWEVFNGADSYSPLFGIPVGVTLKTIDPAYLSKITSVHNRANNEIWLSVPNRTGGAAAVTLVYNYVADKFYTFKFHKTPSCLVEARDSTYLICTIMGTTDGYVYTCESGTQDGTTNIDAYARTNWMRKETYYHLRMNEFEFEAPDSTYLSVSTYINMAPATVNSYSLTGHTPTVTDVALRLPIKDKKELGLKFQYVALYFSNSGNVGSAMKLNYVKMLMAPMVRHDKISGS